MAAPKLLGIAHKIDGYFDLQKNELRNARVQNLAADPGTPVSGQIYYNTGNNTLRFYNNTSFVTLTTGSGMTFGVVTGLTVGGANVDGVGTDAARNDHVHALAAFGTVTAATTFGIASGNGAAGTFSRSDHAHGTPAAPTASSVGAVANGGLAPSITSAVTGSRPAAATVGALFLDTTTMRWQRDTGAAWVDVDAFAAPSASAVGDASSNGAANTYANSGHVHAREAFATPALTLGTANAAGAAATLLRSDATILAFDATAPSTQAIGDAAVVGVATVATRRDHKHAMPAFATGSITLSTAASAGSAATLIRSDAVIAAFDATVPTVIAVGDAAAAGSVAFAARRDHTHGMVAFAGVSAQTSFGAASANGAATTLARSDHTHGTPTHIGTDHSAISITSLSNPTADRAWGGFKITGLGDPTAAQDAATKNYVDLARQGLEYKDSVAAATTGVLPNTPTYANGTAGVGATLTASSNVAFPATIDGQATTVVGTRILVKDQAAALQNGIYTLTTVGSGAAAWVLTRATDQDSSTSTPPRMTAGDVVYADAGTVNGGQLWAMNQIAAITMGTTGITWTQISGASTATAGAGLTATGNVLAVGQGAGITVAADTVAVDTAVVVTKFSTSIGNGALTALPVTHSLGTKDVHVVVYDNSSPFAEIECDVEHTSTSVVTINVTTAPTTNQYRVTVFA